MLVVLGGSSPWTVELLTRLSATDITLVGRDRDALLALQAYGRAHTDLAVRISTDPIKALANSSVVLCQVRIGGANGRFEDESGPSAWGGFGDETLGLGGLRSAARAKSTIASWARASGGAPTVMFTNPTDLLSRWWALNSGGDCVSVCELPKLVLANSPAQTRYLGVNHLGLGVTPSGEEIKSVGLRVLDRVDEVIASQRENGVRRALEVGALAEELRASISSRDEDRTRLLLKARTPHWYRLVVVPVLEQLVHGRIHRGIVGLPNRGRLPRLPDQLVVESRSTSLIPDPLEYESVVVERVSEYAVTRELAWQYLIKPSRASLAAYIAGDPFSRQVRDLRAVEGWMQSAG